MSTIKITNSNLALFLDYELNKIGNEFSDFELKKIKKLHIDLLNEFNEIENVDYKIFDYVTNVETLILKHFTITDTLIDKIKKYKNLKSISFETCIIDNFDKIGEINVDYLSITGNAFLRTDFLKGKNQYKGLILNDSDLIDIENLKDMKKLELLSVNNSDVQNPELISELSSLLSLYIENTNIDNVSFLENLSNIKQVGLDRELYISFIKDLEKLEENGTVFLENGYIPLIVDEKNDNSISL